MTLQAVWSTDGGAPTHPTPLSCSQLFSLILPSPVALLHALVLTTGAGAGVSGR